MKDWFKNLKTIFARKPLVSGISIGVLLLAVVIGFSGGGEKTAAAVAVKRGAIAEQVIVTGKIEPAQNAALAFERTGKISALRVAVGDRVTKNQVMAELERANLLAELSEALAAIEVQRLKLEELKKGARPEELRLWEAKVTEAEKLQAEAQENLEDALFESYAKADDALRNKADQFFSNPRSFSPQLLFSAGEPQLKIDAEFERAVLENSFDRWLLDLRAGDWNAMALNRRAAAAKDNLVKLRTFLDKVALIVNDLTPSAALSPGAITAYKNDVAVVRTNALQALNSLTAAGQGLTRAESNLEIATRELALKKSPGTPEQLDIQNASIKQAEARAAGVRAEIAKTYLRAPFSGMVTKVNAEVGEIALTNQPFAALQSEEKFEIEANIPEVDIGKLTLGNRVKVTLDAFPGEIFSGRVMAIDPGETIIDGIVNFKITVALENGGSALKSGLTANLAIETRRKENVLIVPQSAVIETDQGTFVKKVARGAIQEIPVRLGIRGEDGNVEIVSGLAEVDKILNFGLKSETRQ